MKRFKFGRKVAIVGVVTSLALVAGGVAFADILATGSGTGNGTVGKSTSSNAKLTVTVSTCTVATMLPGGHQTCSFKINNPTTALVKFEGAGDGDGEQVSKWVARQSSSQVGHMRCCHMSGIVVSTGTTTKVTTSVATTSLAANTTSSSAGNVKLTFTTAGTAVAQTSCLGQDPIFTVHVPS